MGRTDDVLNVAGHRLSTGSIEAALAGHPDVAECAVIGVADDFKGQVPRGLVVLKGGVDGTGDDGIRICKELVQRVRDEVGAVASLRQVDIVGALPKTRSGKILRKTMREMADGKDPDGARHHRGRRACSTPSRRCCPRRLTHGHAAVRSARHCCVAPNSACAQASTPDAGRPVRGPATRHPGSC